MKRTHLMTPPRQSKRDTGQARSTDERPSLNRHISVKDFREFYWLKAELQGFCREVGLPSSGGKREIAARIDAFLRSDGRAPATTRAHASRPRARVNDLATSELSMSTRAPAGFTCSQAVRRFFEREVSPQFRFTVTLQQHIKANPGISFEQIAEQWRREHAARKAGTLEPPIAPQFEYNQFTRDFHADPNNAGKTRQDCLAAWKRTRARRGDNKYRPGS